MSDFSARLITWHHRHGRHDLPWQKQRDPYRVWLSEIMLQQTQVTTVIPYYQRFLERFPTLADLAAAPVEEVMALWSGLGYYARARNLHACARRIQETHGGYFPTAPETLATLPGIGRSTANAIATFCFNARAPILDGNVKRVLTRCFGIDGFPGTSSVEKTLWALAASLLPAKATDTAAYIQAQMDLGATVCTRGKPRCTLCPLAVNCVAHRDARTTELPAPRPRKILPERHATVLLLYRGDAILLEVRPTTGVWGGLLSLPELSEHIDPDIHARDALVIPTSPWRELNHLSHTLTHFRLHLRPLMAQTCDEKTPLGHRWVNIADLGKTALPTPIRRILETAFT